MAAMGEQRPRAPAVVSPLEEGSSTPPLDPEAIGAAWAGGRSGWWRRWRVESPRAVLILASVIKFAVMLSGAMVLLPFFRVLEDAFCHRHFGDTSPGFIEEQRCKVPEVQKDLAFLMGWLMLVTGLVGVVIALPYGALADRVGRKPILIMAYSGMMFGIALSPLYFHYYRDTNPYWILPGCLFQAVGGGIPVAFTMLYAIAADVTDEQKKGSSFLMLMIGATAGGLIGPLLSGILMETFHPWFPIYTASAASPLILTAMLFLPETLKRKAASEHSPSQSVTEWASAQISQSLSQARDATSLLRTRSVAIVLATFLIFNPVNTAHSMTLVQYVSQQFGWDIAQTSFLLSPLGVLNIIVLAGLPKVADALTSSTSRFRLSPFRKDVALTRFSLLFIVVACLIEAVSRSIFLFIFGLFVGAFGAAASPLSRALLTHYVDSKYTSRLMALITIVETMGSFLGGPVIAMFFQIGQEKGGSLTGLPFLYVGSLAGGAFVCLLYIQVPRKQEADEVVVDLPEPYADEPEREEAYSDEPDAPLLSANERS